MKTRNPNFLRLAIATSLYMLFLSSTCEMEPPVPENTRSYGFTVKLDDAKVANATVSIFTENKHYYDLTDSDGECEIRIPDEVNLPEYLIVTVDHSNIRPKALSVSGSTGSISHKVVPCRKTPSRVLVEEVDLHHLGNDQYSGAANSQHQLPTEGIEKSFNFYLSSIPSEMPRIQLYARGVQHPAKVKINGLFTSTLGDSPDNGDLQYYDGYLSGNPNSLLQVGNNTLTIQTGEYNQSDPWDDIEFCALILYYP